MTMHASSVRARVVTHLLLVRRVSGESEISGTIDWQGQRACTNSNEQLAKDGLTVGMRNLCLKSVPLLLSHSHAATEVALVHKDVKAAKKESQCLERDPNEQNVGVRHVCGEILDSAIGDRQDGCSTNGWIPVRTSANTVGTAYTRSGKGKA